MVRRCLAVVGFVTTLWASPTLALCTCPDQFPLRLVGSTTLQIAVAWDAVPEAQHYVLERSTTCSFSPAATYVLPNSVTAYGDTGKQPSDRFRFHDPSGLSAGIDYYYRVRAQAADHSEQVSSCVSARLAAGPVRGVAGDLWADVVLGQPDFGQNEFRKTTAAATQWAGGVRIDRAHSPQRMYVADANHNRVLGYTLSGQCTGIGADLARGKAYTASVAASSSYPDTGTHEFTDGQIAHPWGTSTDSFGFAHGSAPLTVDLDVDLGSVSTFNAMTLDSGAGTDRYSAANVELFASLDAQQWTLLGQFDNPNRVQLLTASFADASGRYVRFRVHARTGCVDCDWLFLGEGELGYATGAGQACTSDSECDTGLVCALDAPVTPSVVLGQPSFDDHAACNFDGTGQLFPQRAVAGADSMCLIEPLQVSIGETIFGAMMDVDDQGALYLPDSFNHRVLKFDDPFTTDTIADDVWGQADFSGNTCNRGGAPAANTLCREGPHSGVAIDDQGNLWVADPGNSRVLRFPNNGFGIAHDADVALGQPSLTTNSSGGVGRPLTQMAHPYDVAFDRVSRRLYVADAGYAPQDGRVLEFAAPFSTGMAARRALPVTLYCDFAFPGLAPMSLVLDSQRHGLWVENSCYFSELFDLDTSPPALRARVKVVVSDGIDVDRDGNLYTVSKWYDLYRFPRAGLGTDYTANEAGRQTLVTGGRNPATADAFYHIDGVTQLGNQLIVADAHRLLIWNNFDVDAISNGAPADDLLGEARFGVETFQQYFAYPQVYNGQLWVQRSRGGDLDLLVFDAPLTNASLPVDVIPLTHSAVFAGYPVLGCPGDARCNCAGDDCAGNQVWVQGADGVDFAVSAGGDEIWVADRWNSRVLRIANRLGQRDGGRGMFVDVILGQADLAGTDCNRGIGPLSPTAESLCRVYDLALDAQGNLYVADNGGEAGSNMRLLEFDAGLLAPPATVAAFAVTPSRVFGTGGDYTHTGDSALSDPFISPFKPALHPAGYLIVGNNPYDTQRFPVVFTNPLAESLPQLILGDFTSYPSGSSYVDNAGNLFFSDSNWARLLIYKDPFRVLAGGLPGPSPTPTATRTPIPTPTPDCVGGVPISTPRLGVTRNRNPAGDETLRVSGRLDLGSLAASFDPAANGLGFSVLDQAGGVVFTRGIPAGAGAPRAPGWHVNSSRRRWVFTDPSGNVAGGIRRVTLQMSASVPGRVTFTISGRGSDFQVRPDQIPVRLRIVLGGPAQGAGGLCGGVSFNPPGGAAPACQLTRSGALLSCR